MNSKKGSKDLLCFVSYQNGKNTWEHPLDQSQLMIGTSNQCDIVLNSEHVSFYHAYITLLAPDHGIITDLGSKNGVKINNKTVQKGEFFTGDRITIADKEIYVEERSSTLKLKNL